MAGQSTGEGSLAGYDDCSLMYLAGGGRELKGLMGQSAGQNTRQGSEWWGMMIAFLCTWLSGWRRTVLKGLMGQAGARERFQWRGMMIAVFMYQPQGRTRLLSDVRLVIGNKASNRLY